MSRFRGRNLTLCCGCLVVGAFVAGSYAHAGKGKPDDLPKSAEKAVAAVRAAFPKAEINEAVEPKGFGGSGGKGTPLFWTVRFHTGEKKQELVEEFAKGPLHTSAAEKMTEEDLIKKAKEARGKTSDKAVVEEK